MRKYNNATDLHTQNFERRLPADVRGDSQVGKDRETVIFWRNLNPADLAVLLTAFAGQGSKTSKISHSKRDLPERPVPKAKQPLPVSALKDQPQ